jgi:hypothetical protein
MTTKLQGREQVDVALMAREITQSLIDMVLDHDKKDQGPLLAQIIDGMVSDYLERSGKAPNRRRDN